MSFKKEHLDAWTYTHFQAFLLLYAASSDLTIKEQELEKLIQKTGYASYKEILPVFEQQSDYERLQTILYFKPRYFASNQEAEKIIADVRAMYELDNTFSQEEQGIYLLLRKILS
jgi:hypothetical protein